MTWLPPLRLAAVATFAAATAVCGGGNSGGGGNPTPTGPTTPADGMTITITSSGVNPRSLTVPRGSRVTFVNNDSRSHEMASDPHPSHGSCPEIDQVGFIAVGQSRATGNLNTARTCRYHDHNLFDNTSLQGTIIIQ